MKVNDIILKETIPKNTPDVIKNCFLIKKAYICDSKDKAMVVTRCLKQQELTGNIIFKRSRNIIFVYEKDQGIFKGKSLRTFEK